MDEPPCCENPRSHSLTTSFLGRLVTFSCLPSVKVRRKNKNGMPAHIFVVDDQHDQPSQGRRSTTTVSNVSRRNGRPAAIAGARHPKCFFFFVRRFPKYVMPVGSVPLVNCQAQKFFYTGQLPRKICRTGWFNPVPNNSKPHLFLSERGCDT